MDSTVVTTDREGRNTTTGKRKFFDDKQWQDEPNKESRDLQAVLQELLQTDADLLTEIRLLRIGMIAAGTCNEIFPRELESLTPINQ